MPALYVVDYLERLYLLEEEENILEKKKRYELMGKHV
jgi:hypothetical protein